MFLCKCNLQKKKQLCIDKKYAERHPAIDKTDENEYQQYNEDFTPFTLKHQSLSLVQAMEVHASHDIMDYSIPTPESLS